MALQIKLYVLIFMVPLDDGQNRLHQKKYLIMQYYIVKLQIFLVRKEK